MKIAIIGAGYTGLSAAYDLAKAGHEVTILEHSPTVGGLASGFTIEGTSLEKAYHHIYPPLAIHYFAYHEVMCVMQFPDSLFKHS